MIINGYIRFEMRVLIRIPIGTASETDCEIANRIQVGVVVSFKPNFLTFTYP